MSATSITDPRRFKAEIGRLKERLTSMGDGEEEGADHTCSPPSDLTRRLSSSYRLLLATELLLRGIGVSVPDDDDDGASSEQLLDAIVNTAGKPLLDESSGMPKPLLAGASALSGMAAESCAQLCHRLASSFGVRVGDDEASAAAAVMDPPLASLNLLAVDGANFDGKALRTAMDRCKEVSDDRFLSLLGEASDLASTLEETRRSSSGMNGLSGAAVGQLGRTYGRMRISFLTVAKGQYLRAASEFANPDQPQMWRRALDAVLLLHATRMEEWRGRGDADVESGLEAEYRAYHTPEAVVPLTNLSRIASARGNMKKSVEWNLRLVEALLAKAEAEAKAEAGEGGGGGGGLGGGDDDFTRELATCDRAFSAGTTGDGGGDGKKSTLAIVDEARDVLSSLPRDVDLDRDLELLRAILEFRVELAHEDASIDAAADESYTAARNRSSAGTTATSSFGGSGRGRAGGGISPSGVKKKKAPSSAKAKVGDTDVLPDRSTFTVEARRKILSENAGGKADSAASALQRRILEDLMSGDDRGGGGETGDRALAQDPPPTPTISLFQICEDRGLSPSLVVAALRLTETNLRRLVDRAQAVALASAKAARKKKAGSRVADDGRASSPSSSGADPHGAWKAAADFALPMIRAMNDVDAYSSSPSAMSPLRRSAEVVIQTSWHTAGGLAVDPAGATSSVDGDAPSTSSAVSFDDLALAVSILERVSAHASARAGGPRGATTDEKQTTLDEETRRREEEANTRSGDMAMASGRCMVALSRVGDYGGAHSLLSDAILEAAGAASAQKRVVSDGTDDDVAYGTAYLRFLLAWSGMSRRPWPHSTITESRVARKRARECVVAAARTWGRPVTRLETILLDLGEADSEGFISGGFTDKSYALYRRILVEIEDNDRGAQDGSMKDPALIAVLNAHCRCGLSFVSLHHTDDEINDTTHTEVTAEREARSALATINSKPVSNPDGLVFTCVPTYLRSTMKVSVPFHICTARQLVAESLLRTDQICEAGQFLEDAVNESPHDFSSSFALGAFRLRSALATGKNPSEFSATEKKVASTQLLKAAKLDTNEADPFALLGCWYECMHDHKRAIGCHSKALLLDSSHPVSGRGILRLRSFGEAKHLCQRAARLSSPVNGWAWAALGRAAAMEDGNDAIAISYLQRALRCRDIERAEYEDLAPFYGDPTERKSDTIGCECGRVWVQLAGCYRRLGKYSAAIVAYQSAYEAARGDLPSYSLCAWAQVEMELGLFDEALSRFREVLKIHDSDPIAAFGVATCLLEAAKACAVEGKFGASFDHLANGISALMGSIVKIDDAEKKYVSRYACALKLLGDMYSFGAILPPNIIRLPSNDMKLPKASVFDQAGIDTLEPNIQLEFVANGEAAYGSALAFAHNSSADSDKDFSVATAHCNLGVNQLTQARLWLSWLAEGSGGGSKTALIELASSCKSVKDLLKRSADNFRAAIDSDEYLSPAWCGLGTAMIGTDPLLAQHCFCRSLEIDKTLPDSWANLGLAYIEYSLWDWSSEMLDGLTQVADSPLMWIGRGLLLQGAVNGAVPEEDEANLSRAADAFRTSLQVAQNPSALLGLALTSRRMSQPTQTTEQDESYILASQSATRSESIESMSMYLDSPEGYNIGGQLVGGLMNLEECTSRQGIPGRLLQERGAALIKESTSKLSMLREIDYSVESCQSDGSALRRTDISGFSLADQLNAVDSAASEIATAKAIKDEDGYDSEQLADDRLEVARKEVHENPESGEMWLSFGKALADEATCLDQYGGDRLGVVTGLNAARTAVLKSSSILHERLISVNLLTSKRPLLDDKADGQNSREELVPHKAVVPEFVDASILSESLALRSWLDVVLSETAPEEERKNLAKDTGFKLDLQRSLMIDPENLVARRGLKLIIG